MGREGGYHLDDFDDKDKMERYIKQQEQQCNADVDSDDSDDDDCFASFRVHHDPTIYDSRDAAELAIKKQAESLALTYGDDYKILVTASYTPVSPDSAAQLEELEASFTKRAKQLVRAPVGQLNCAADDDDRFVTCTKCNSTINTDYLYGKTRQTAASHGICNVCGASSSRGSFYYGASRPEKQVMSQEDYKRLTGQNTSAWEGKTPQEYYASVTGSDLFTERTLYRSDYNELLQSRRKEYKTEVKTYSKRKRAMTQEAPKETSKLRWLVASTWMSGHF